MSGIQWWHLPALFTVVVLAAMGRPSKRAHNPFLAIVKLILILLGVIAVLIAWLAGALLR